MLETFSLPSLYHEQACHIAYALIVGCERFIRGPARHLCGGLRRIPPTGLHLSSGSLDFFCPSMPGEKNHGPEFSLVSHIFTMRARKLDRLPDGPARWSKNPRRCQKPEQKISRPGLVSNTIESWGDAHKKNCCCHCAAQPAPPHLSCRRHH